MHFSICCGGATELFACDGSSCLSTHCTQTDILSNKALNRCVDSTLVAAPTNTIAILFTCLQSLSPPVGITVLVLYYCPKLASTHCMLRASSHIAFIGRHRCQHNIVCTRANKAKPGSAMANSAFRLKFSPNVASVRAHLPSRQHSLALISTALDVT